MSEPPASPQFDLLGIGNAIVDVVAATEDDFLSRHGMHKGTMRLIAAEEAEALYAAMPPGQESSGGSAANTCAVAAGLGARVAFLGKVADDQLGRVFRHDITAAGVHYPTPPLATASADSAAPTARSMILVTPDAQRTMNTFLGACVGFEPAARRAGEAVALAVLTRGEAGSLILRGAERVEIDAAPARLVDTTGAGDAYAAGFLAAYVRGQSLPVCGRLGSLAAAAVLEHFGARPRADLRALARQVM